MERDDFAAEMRGCDGYESPGQCERAGDEMSFYIYEVDFARTIV